MLRMLGTFVLFASLFCQAARAQVEAKPGPEMEILKKTVGTWDTEMKADGMPSMKGTTTYESTCNGMWISSIFKMDFGGQPFEGRGQDGYDQSKKKYVSLWVDSMSSNALVFEGTLSADGKVLNMKAEGPAPDGKMAIWRSVTTFKDDNHHTFEMYLKSGDMPESKMMTTEYTRRK